MSRGEKSRGLVRRCRTDARESYPDASAFLIGPTRCGAHSLVRSHLSDWNEAARWIASMLRNHLTRSGQTTSPSLPIALPQFRHNQRRTGRPPRSGSRDSKWRSPNAFLTRTRLRLLTAPMEQSLPPNYLLHRVTKQSQVSPIINRRQRKDLWASEFFS